MTSPFKSTRSVAARRRQRPVIERSTFVVATIGSEYIALPVEQVERVVRMGTLPHDDQGAAPAAMIHHDASLPLTCLHSHLGGGAPANTLGERRVIIVRVTAAHDGRWALLVDGVSEVFSIETALVQPIDAQRPAPFPHRSVRGYFARGNHDVWIVDAARLGAVA